MLFSGLLLPFINLHFNQQMACKALVCWSKSLTCMGSSFNLMGFAGRKFKINMNYMIKEPETDDSNNNSNKNNYHFELDDTARKKLAVLSLCQQKKRAPKNNEINAYVKRPVWEKRKVIGCRIKIMLEGQLVDPQIYISVQNSLISPTDQLHVTYFPPSTIPFSSYIK